MNKYNRINLYKKRAETFARRTISMFEKINYNEDFSREMTEFYTKLLESAYNEDIVADHVTDFSESLADEYILMSNGIYSAVLTGFYHLWERDVKDLCKHMLLYHPVNDGNKRVTEQIIQDYKYDRLKDLLMHWGAEESFFNELNILRLVVNTIKHSAGPSAAELSINHRKYYHKLSILCDLRISDLNIDAENFMLDIEDLKYFGLCVNTFWDKLCLKISL